MKAAPKAAGYVEDPAEVAADQLCAWDANTRRFGLQSLGLLGPAAAEHVPAMAKLLEDEEPEVRRAACAALGRVKGGASDLVKALRDAEAGVRAEAATALGGQALPAGQLTSLASMAKDVDQEVQLAAVKSLATLNQATYLDQFMLSGFPTVVRAAVMEMGRCPLARQEHSSCLSTALSHEDASVRLAAAQACGELGVQCKEAHFRALTMRTSDPQVKVRRAAVQALGRAAPAGGTRIPAFFKDKEDSIRHFAAETLGSTGDEAAAAVCAELLVSDGPVHVKSAALLALGRMKLPAWSPQVAGCLHDPDLGTRLAAIQALSDLGAESQAQELQALSRDKNKGVRQAAVAALAKMGSAGAEAACSFLEDQDPAVRQSAVRVYSPLHSKLKASFAKPYVELVAQRLLDEDWRVRLAAVVALGDLDARRFAEELGALHQDPDLQVRRSAVAALEKLSASPALVACFLGDSDEAVRNDAQRVYEALAGEEELSEAD